MIFQKRKITISGVSDPKFPEYDLIPKCNIFRRGRIYLTIWGANGKSGCFLPPTFEGSGGQKRHFLPPIFEGSGGQIFGFCPPQSWGANRSIFEKILRNQIPDYRFSFRKSHFRFQNWQNFRLRPLVLSYQIPKIFACGAFDFYVCFDRFSGFICPPYLRGLGGKFFVAPHIWGVWGANEKAVAPQAWGANVQPCAKGKAASFAWIESILNLVGCDLKSNSQITHLWLAG